MITLARVASCRPVGHTSIRRAPRMAASDTAQGVLSQAGSGAPRRVQAGSGWGSGPGGSGSGSGTGSGTGSGLGSGGTGSGGIGAGGNGSGGMGSG
ncbi:hypothetical protein GCM10009642_61380 [Nocardiopsis metallicus]